MFNLRDLKEVHGYALGRIIYEPKDPATNYVYDVLPTIVWRAEKDGKPCVVKRSTDGRGIKRERWALERLAGLPVQKVIDAFSDDAYYLVTEPIPGTHFPIKLDGTLSAADAIAALGNAAEIVNDCHERGAIHCDLRAPNILLKEQTTPVLIDFGIAGRPYSPISSFSKSDDLLEHWPPFSRNSPLCFRTRAMDFHTLATVLDIALGNTFAYPLYLPKYKLTRLAPAIDDPVLRRTFDPLVDSINAFYANPDAATVISGLRTLDGSPFDDICAEFIADTVNSRAGRVFAAYKAKTAS